MPNRFDIFISKLETKTAREGMPPHPITEQSGAALAAWAAGGGVDIDLHAVHFIPSLSTSSC